MMAARSSSMWQRPASRRSATSASTTRWAKRSSSKSTRPPRHAACRWSATSGFRPKDTSVVGQTLKLIAAKPDAIVIGASGTPAALPARTLIEQGYKGKLYFNHGVANNDFLRVGGKDVENAFVPASPVIVAAQLPDNHPVQEARTRLRQGVRSGERRGQRFGVRLVRVGRVPRARACNPAARSDARSRERRNSGMRSATRWRTSRSSRVTNGAVNMSKTDHLA